MSAALPPTVKHAIAVGHMSKERVVKGIEQTWCRASKSARRDGKFAATMWRLLSSTPVLGIALQPLYFTLLARQLLVLKDTLPSQLNIWYQMYTYVYSILATFPNLAVLALPMSMN